MKDINTVHISPKSSMKIEMPDANSPSSRHSAFTFVEMAVVIVIMGIMGAVTLHYLGSSAGVYVAVLAQKRADNELLDAVNRMRREARALRSIDNKDSTLTGWAFVNVKSESINFYLDDDYIMLNGYPLARGVERLEFSYFDAANQEFALPLKQQDVANIARVQMSLRVTNNMASAETIVNFHLLKDYLK